MSRLSTGPSISKRAHLLAATGWMLWATFVVLWAVSLLPFYASGLHLASEVSLEYAGGGYARFNIPYVPLPEAVYGTSIFGDIARSIVCNGPCIFVLAAAGALWKLLTSWRSYSRVG